MMGFGKAVSYGSQDTRYRVHRATRVLYVRSGLDDQNLTRLQKLMGSKGQPADECYKLYDI